MKIGHLGVNVSDLERSVSWYGDVLGACPFGGQFTMPDGTRVQFVVIGSFEIEMIEPAVPLPPSAAAGPSPAGFFLGIEIPDRDRESKRLQRNGFQPLPAEIAGTDGEVFQIYGPDGELLRYFAGGPAAEGPRVAHLGITVSDVDGGVEWMRRYFGATPADSSGAGSGPNRYSRRFEAGPTALELRCPVGDNVGGEPIEPSFQRVGSWHLCLDVDDPGLLLDDMTDAGAAIVVPLTSPDRGPYIGRRHFFSRGPDGVYVQVRALE